MSDLTPEDRALIDAARDGGVPTAADRARVQRRLAAQLGAAALGLTATTTATSAAAGGWLSGLTATKVVLALTVIGGVGAGGAVAIRSHATRTPAPMMVTVAAPAPSTVVAAPAAESPEPPPEPPPEHEPAPPPEPPPEPSSVIAVAPHAKTAMSSRPTPTPTPERRSTLDEEIAALAQADAAVRRGDGAAALAQLDEHARRFPKSAVREERQVERVLALCAAGRVDEARKDGEALLRSRPSSPYLPRLRASCVFP